MAEKKSAVRKSGDLIGAYTHAKGYVAAMSVPLTVLIIYLIETLAHIDLPLAIEAAIGMLLAGVSTTVVPNAKK